MRFAFRIDLRKFAPYAALCATLVLSALPDAVHAQAAQAVQASSATLAESAGASNAALAGTEPIATISPDATAGTADPSAPLVRNASDTSSDAASENDIALDDPTLSRQRGGAVGMLMVAATPQLMRGNSGARVTLWDEIAPPSPLPIPVDAARSAQSNVATYQRK